MLFGRGQRTCAVSVPRFFYPHECYKQTFSWLIRTYSTLVNFSYAISTNSLTTLAVAIEDNENSLKIIISLLIDLRLILQV